MWYMYTPDKLSNGLFYASCICLHSCIFATPWIVAFNYKIRVSIGMGFQLIFEQKSIFALNAEKNVVLYV